MAGTDGGANEEATGQFDSRAICSKYKPTFADTYSINQYMALKSTIPDALHICFIHGVATNRGAWGFDLKATEIGESSAGVNSEFSVKIRSAFVWNLCASVSCV